MDVGTSFTFHDNFDHKSVNHTGIGIAASRVVFPRLLENFKPFVVGDLFDCCFYVLIVPTVGKTMFRSWATNYSVVTRTNMSVTHSIDAPPRKLVVSIDLVSVHSVALN